MKYKWVWLLILLMLVGDVVTTIYGLQAGYSEANPTVANMMETYGEVEAMMLLSSVKLIAVGAGMAGQLAAAQFGKPKLRKWFPLIVMAVLALPPVVWNLWVLA